MNKLLEYLNKGFSKKREQLVQRPKDRGKICWCVQRQQEHRVEGRLYLDWSVGGKVL